MPSSNLMKMWMEFFEAANKEQRFYKLDDKFAMHIEIIPSRHEPVLAHSAIYERLETDQSDSPVEWDCVDLESLPARLLTRVAEIKLSVERWNTNELEALPPSTMEDFLAPQQERRLIRRRRRMLR